MNSKHTTDQIIVVMRENKITRAELARRLNISRSAVTQMFKNSNWTLESLKKIEEALGVIVTIQVSMQ